MAGTSMYWFFIGAMMSAPNLNAWLPRSHDSVSRYSNWFGVLELRQEVGRAETAEAGAAEVAVDGDAREAAGDDRVGDHAGDLRRGGRRQPERLLHGVGRERDHEKRASLTMRRREHARPAADDGVGLDRLVAEGRRAGAVDDAAERAGNLRVRFE